MDLNQQICKLSLATIVENETSDHDGFHVKKVYMSIGGEFKQPFSYSDKSRIGIRPVKEQLEQN